MNGPDIAFAVIRLYGFSLPMPVEAFVGSITRTWFHPTRPLLNGLSRGTLLR